MAKIRQATNSDVPTSQLFRTPTIADLAQALERMGQGEAEQAIPRASFSAAERAAGVPCSANQQQMLVLHQMQPDNASYNMVESLGLRGEVSAEALQARTCALRMCAQGTGLLRGRPIVLLHLKQVLKVDLGSTWHPPGQLASPSATERRV